MCRHVLNAPVSLQFECCSNWYECQECHDADQKTHRGRLSTEYWVLCCLACRAVFKVDMQLFSAADKLCPQCSARIDLPACTPEGKLTEVVKAALARELSELLAPF